MTRRRLLVVFRSAFSLRARSISEFNQEVCEEGLRMAHGLSAAILPVTKNISISLLHIPTQKIEREKVSWQSV
jgi:hypothetical protein